uniref:Uncharacterized protein n=1 Tax=Arion vulgaris TaxID=1028688 RepID=A0A0B7AGV4_9EUPU
MMWYTLLRQGAAVCETSRTAAAELRRQARKIIHPIIADIPCPRAFQAFISHLHTHRLALSK